MSQTTPDDRESDRSPGVQNPAPEEAVNSGAAPRGDRKSRLEIGTGCAIDR